MRLRWNMPIRPVRSRLPPPCKADRHAIAAHGTAPPRWCAAVRPAARLCRAAGGGGIAARTRRGLDGARERAGHRGRAPGRHRQHHRAAAGGLGGRAAPPRRVDRRAGRHRAAGAAAAGQPWRRHPGAGCRICPLDCAAAAFARLYRLCAGERGRPHRGRRTGRPQRPAAVARVRPHRAACAPRRGRGVRAVSRPAADARCRRPRRRPDVPGGVRAAVGCRAGDRGGDRARCRAGGRHAVPAHRPARGDAADRHGGALWPQRRPVHDRPQWRPGVARALRRRAGRAGAAGARHGVDVPYRGACSRGRRQRHLPPAAGRATDPAGAAGAVAPDAAARLRLPRLPRPARGRRRAVGAGAGERADPRAGHGRGLPLVPVDAHRGHRHGAGDPAADRRGRVGAAPRPAAPGAQRGAAARDARPFARHHAPEGPQPRLPGAEPGHAGIDRTGRARGAGPYRPRIAGDARRHAGALGHRRAGDGDRAGRGTCLHHAGG
ncbi:hypothetical protein D3C81_983050 [compost metagenome]